MGRTVSVHGHRGSRGTRPENTLASFADAVAAGADYFELDVQGTKDDVPIVFHDDFISPRICLAQDGTVPDTKPFVNDVTLAELKRYYVGRTPQTDFPEQTLMPSEHMPTLEEVFTWMADKGHRTGINIEIKAPLGKHRKPEIYCKKVCDLILRYQMQTQVMVQSFDFDLLDIVKEHAPSLILSYLFDETEDFAERGATLGAKIVAPNFQNVTAQQVKQAHKMGMEVLPWTVNEKSDWANLIEWGVDGIITDYPKNLIQMLLRNSR
jgi:glycerophosphoryl diester phosphodiesterase